LRFSLSWLADHVELANELGLRADESGRHRFARPTDAEKQHAFDLGKRLTSIGLAVEDYPIERFGSDQEITLEVEVTSNRPDCMNHFGLARELATALERPLRRPDTPVYGSSSSDGSSGRVVLEDAEGCPRYVAREIRGVRIAPSPEWLRRRLESIGQKPINNVVDATNYAMWELGQPLHAFDLGTIPGGEVHVRRARAGERLTTLDGKERELDPEVLVIADRERAIALAGIMGGLDTEVTAATADVLLESAFFERRRVRIGAKRLGMHTEASHRFERGADPEGCDAASRRCAQLIVELAGGEVGEAIDAIARPHRRLAWRLEKRALDRFVGAEVPPEAIERILAALQFSPRRTGEGIWEGEVPGFRAVDFEPRRGDSGELSAYPQDLFEEVLRHWGFDRVEGTLPRLSGVDAGGSPAWDRRGRVQRFCRGLGFAEGIHYAFQDRAADARFPALVAGPAPALVNPLSDRYAVMRRSLVPNLVGAALFNLHRGASTVRLFEVGHLFAGDGEEVEAVGLIAAGGGAIPWDRDPAADLLELKGSFEALMAELGAGAEATAADLPGVVAGTGGELSARGETVGWFGRVEAPETTVPLFAGELLLDRLPVEPARRPIESPARFPGIAVDTTLTHPLGVAWTTIAAAIDGARSAHLREFRLKDRYQGQGIPVGAVATTITFEYLDSERTLTLEEVAAAHAALAADLERRFGVARAGGAMGGA
jgi:phenylalanyl-tRNA synthetase beta chain